MPRPHLQTCRSHAKQPVLPHQTDEAIGRAQHLVLRTANKGSKPNGVVQDAVISTPLLWGGVLSLSSGVRPRGVRPRDRG
jgi:hypothetical protein